MIIKVGRNEYDIKSNDVFMDNGACVTLLSQSKERLIWGRRANPVLSKMAIKEISVFKRIEVKNAYSDMVSTFTLDIKGGE